MRRISLIASVVFVLIGLPLIYAYTHRPATVSKYFRLERRWGERWPKGNAALQELEPFLRKIGILVPVRIQVERGVSFLLDPGDLIPLTILRTGQWQPEVWASIAPALSPGSVFLDVGAHIGYFSVKAAAHLGNAGRVVAFEPNPETLRDLRENVAASQARIVTVEPIACTDREQTLTLYAAPLANSGASSLARQNAEISVQEAVRAYSVRGRPIDDVVRELELTRVDVIKIDVEGAEVSVLRGALNTLRRFHPKVVVEVVPRQLAGFHTSPDDVSSLMRGAGYTVGRPLGPEETDWEWTAQEPASTIRMAEISTSRQLIHGFYDLEQNSWRWTAGRFTVALRPPAGADKKGAWIALEFVLPEVAFNKLKGVTVSAKIEGASLRPSTFTTPGKNTYRVEAPASCFSKRVVEVDFFLDRVLAASEYGRELGIIVTSVGMAPQ